MNFKLWLEESEPPVQASQDINANQVLYTACVLDKISQNYLIAEVEKLMIETLGSGIPRREWMVRAHHMTIKFRPNQADIESIQDLLGQEVNLLVTDWAVDTHAVAVVVKPQTSLPTAAIPHITVGHSRDVGPAYSNTLLAQKIKWHRVSKPITLRSYVVCVTQYGIVPEVVNLASETA